MLELRGLSAQLKTGVPGKDAQPICLEHGEYKANRNGTIGGAGIVIKGCPISIGRLEKAWRNCRLPEEGYGK